MIKYITIAILLGSLSACKQAHLPTEGRCLEQKQRCEANAINEAIKAGIVQEQLLDALGNGYESPKTQMPNNCYQRYQICSKQAQTTTTELSS